MLHMRGKGGLPELLYYINHIRNILNKLKATTTRNAIKINLYGCDIISNYFYLAHLYSPSTRLYILFKYHCYLAVTNAVKLWTVKLWTLLIKFPSLTNVDVYKLFDDFQWIVFKDFCFILCNAKCIAEHMHRNTI